MYLYVQNAEFTCTVVKTNSDQFLWVHISYWKCDFKSAHNVVHISYWKCGFKSAHYVIVDNLRTNVTQKTMDAGQSTIIKTRHFLLFPQ